MKREDFWLEASRAVSWSKPPVAALDESGSPAVPLVSGGHLNTAYNALDRHVEAGRGDQAALIYDSAMLGIKRSYTYSELTGLVARFAGVLRSQGVGKGDRVVIYMPMIPEAAIAMLATARLGAVHSVVFGGFAPKELAARIVDAGPSVIVTASGGIEPSRHVEYLPAVAEALTLAGVGDLPGHRQGPRRLRRHVGGFPGLARLGPDDGGAVPAAPVEVGRHGSALHSLHVRHHGYPEGCGAGQWRPRRRALVDHGEHLRHRPGEVMWTASDVGWVVGHSYIVYGPLLAGATTLLYEGKPVGTPDAGAFWRVVQDHKVNVLFTAPTALRAIRKADPEAAELARYDISTLRTLFAAGERLDTETYRWAGAVLNVPVVDHWWQTETGWAICANPRGLEDLPFKPGSPTVPMPGYGAHHR